MTRKCREITGLRKKRKIDTLWVQETKLKAAKAKNLEDGFKRCFYFVDGKRNGIKVVVKEENRISIAEVKRICGQILREKLVMQGVLVNDDVHTLYRWNVKQKKGLR